MTVRITARGRKETVLFAASRLCVKSLFPRYAYRTIGNERRL